MLDELYYATLKDDSFYEYNDMTAFVYNSELLSAIIKDINDKHCLKRCRYFYDKLWKDMAENFHKYTMQLAGPFMNERDTLDINEFLNDSLGGRLLGRASFKGKKYLSKCPSKYADNFVKYKGNKFEQRLISSGLLYPFFRHSMVATTYMQDKYTFGSFNREKFWEYRKLFIGFFGKSSNPYYFKLNVLHDGNSYASAVNHCVQCNGSAIGHITFITDGGDAHLDADAPNPTLRASDFRIRFQINGDIEKLNIIEEKMVLQLRWKI